MEKKVIPSSELIINEDGSVFHLHLKPEQLRDKIVVMGDPGRVTMVSKHLDTIEFDQQSREFHAVAGTYKGKQVLLLSHGIGSDNIDIVMTELDALANIDFKTRTVNDEHRTLTIVRVGTSGGLQPYVPVGTSVISAKAVGLDGVLNYYAGRNAVCDLALEKELVEKLKWNPLWARPYVVDADAELVKRVGGDDMVHGCTLAAVGFFGPQGREVRMPLAEPEFNHRVEAFEHDGIRITNYEMESAALQGFGKLMGHKTMTVCSIIANRVATDANPNYKNAVDELFVKVLERI